jgi:hypothetical protein
MEGEHGGDSTDPAAYNAYLGLRKIGLKHGDETPWTSVHSSRFLRSGKLRDFRVLWMAKKRRT